MVIVKVLLILFLFTVNTQIFSNSNVATKDDIKMLINYTDKRFEDMNKRFEDMNKRFEDMITMFISCFSIFAGIYIAGVGFLFIKLTSIQRSVDRLESADSRNYNTRVNQITNIESFISNLRELDDNSRQRFKSEIREILEI